MGIHTYVIPDCPTCGQEMKQVMYYEAGTAKDSIGRQMRYWECIKCGWESVHVGNDEWDELTYRIVLGTEN